ncbi:MAG: hypothetical protein GMKNLPBB_03161 [Myxococcota bacterium]|nr:hypothetical protein [Myxococcota bacterium]
MAIKENQNKVSFPIVEQLPPDALTLEKAAWMLDLTRDEVWRRVLKGDLPAFRYGVSWYVRLGDVESHQVRGQA